MKEGECKYKIVAFVNGKRQDITCNQETGCLSKLAWCGIGVNRAAALVLGRSVKGVEACVDGDCKDSVSLGSASEVI